MNAEVRIDAPPETLIGALAKALPELGAVTKNKNNPHFKSNYADLSAVIAALAPLAEYGLWFRQEPRDTDDAIGFETFYIYANGDELSAGITRLPVNKRDAQGYGSAQTYCRRYALQAAFGLAADDDDGNAAANAKPEPKSAEPKRDEQGGMPDAEYSKLANLLQATNTNSGPLIKHYGVKNLRHLNQQQYGEVVGRLEDRLAEMAKAETNQAATTEITDADIPY